MLKKQKDFIHYLFLSTACTVYGISFDGFWHLTRGRESFFVLPHIFVYAGILGAMYVSWNAYKILKDRSWIWLFRVLCIIPLSAPIDELWHRLFGKEVIESPRIIWSFPHLILLSGALTSIVLVTLIISKEVRLKHWFLLGTVTLGMFLNVMVMSLIPIFPAGPHHLLNSSGLGIMATGIISVYFFARRLFPDKGAACITALVCVFFQMIIYDASLYIPEASNFFRLPDWTLILVFFAPAITIDLTDSWYSPTRGMVAGLLMGIIFFWLGSWAPDSSYVYADLWSGTISAAIGGIFAGVMFEHLIPVKNKPA